jgi:hypothetical protein
MERPDWLCIETCEGLPSGRGILAYGLGYGYEFVVSVATCCHYPNLQPHVANLGNGTNDIAYNPGGRVHDIAGMQGDMTQWPDWRQSGHSGIANDL